MNLNDYFDPVDLEKPEEFVHTPDMFFGRNIAINTPNNPVEEISNYRIAIIGVPEERNSHNKGTFEAPDRIRSRLYQLYRVSDRIRIIDLGNLRPGNTFNDTFVALRDVIAELTANQVTAVILGGSQDMTAACYMALTQSLNSVNLVTADATLDTIDSPSGSYNYLARILADRKLFKYTNLGHQQYLTDPDSLELLEKSYFESVRLGQLKNSIFLVEPILRDCNLFSFDIGSVKQSDAPGRISASPNGFFADEACQIARYAGLGDKISCFGIFEVNPRFDFHDLTSTVAAQMIWYFVEGFSGRKNEIPAADSSNFKVFIISHDNMEHDITFLKSLKTDRWWMEVPVVKIGRKIMVACSVEDYQQACNHDIPDLWWKSFRKLN